MDQDQQNSSFPDNRKRDRPQEDESMAQQQQQVNPPATTIAENLIGQAVSGFVEGSFEAGYFLNVKVADTDKQLKGIVFLPNKVTPVTPTTDLFPQAKMYTREDIPMPSSQGTKEAGNQTDEIVSADRNQSATLPGNCPMSEEATDLRNHPLDTEMKDVGGASAVEKVTEPEGQTLSLMPQFASDGATVEDHTVLKSEKAFAANKTEVTVTTTSLKDSVPEGTTTTLVDFFQAPETIPKQASGSSYTLSLELLKNEAKQSGTEEEKSCADAETHGVEEKPASHVDDDVPEELQLELGNKKTSVAATATESKSGFLSSLSEGTAKEPDAASESGFP
ncbi:unnamed protein product [Cochlearia groenlandica]